jgi:drug/metabolite transporter (DMT)-like permease
LFFVSLEHTTLARATLLLYTYVLFSTLFSTLFLRERLPPGSVAALFVSLAGVALITGAGLRSVNRGDAAALLAGLFGGIAITSIRELRKTESAYSIFTVFCAFGVVTSALMSDEPWVLPRGTALAVLAGVGAAATAGQLLMTAAYRHCTAAEGGLLSLVSVVLAALAGLLCFGETMTLRTVAGAMLVLGAAAYLTLAEANV